MKVARIVIAAVASVVLALAVGSTASADPDMTFNSDTPDMTFNSADPDMTFN